MAFAAAWEIDQYVICEQRKPRSSNDLATSDQGLRYPRSETSDTKDLIERAENAQLRLRGNAQEKFSS